MNKPTHFIHQARTGYLRFTGSCFGSCGYSGEWGTFLALKERAVQGGGWAGVIYPNKQLVGNYCRYLVGRVLAAPGALGRGAGLFW